VKRAWLRRLGLQLACGVAVALAVSAFALRGGDDGLFAWLRLRADLASAHARIRALETSVAARRAEAHSLRSDPLAIESAIRTDLRLARPGEWVVRRPEATSLRNP
jgi:cell division protein FtsB